MNPKCQVRVLPCVSVEVREVFAYFFSSQTTTAFVRDTNTVASGMVAVSLSGSVFDPLVGEVLARQNCIPGDEEDIGQMLKVGVGSLAARVVGLRTCHLR